jgi:hypothetical protein
VESVSVGARPRWVKPMVRLGAVVAISVTSLVSRQSKDRTGPRAPLQRNVADGWGVEQS